MKHLILMSVVVLLTLSSCKEKKEDVTNDRSERKIIMPEGYNRGLPFTPGILVDETLYVAGFSG